MSLLRALVVTLALSCAGAGIVAFVSRTPAAVRAPIPDTGDATSEFSDAQVARHGAYRGPLYLAYALSLVTSVVFLVLLRGAPIAELVAWGERLPGWPLRAASVAGVVAVIAVVVVLPMSFVRGYALQKAWHLSTQDATGWLLDQAKGAGLSFVVAGIGAVAFFAVVRWQPRSWWLWGAGAFTILTVLMVFLYPVLIAPLFNRFTPLQDRALVARIEQLAERTGVDVGEVLVADASRRSTTENAYVAGLGATKQVVLYDTLLAAGNDDQAMFVVAHELAHARERHVLKGVAVSVLGLVAGFAALAWLVHSGPLLRWAGVTSIADLRVLPVLLLFVLGAEVVLLPVQNAISRSFEATADRIASRLVDDPEPAAAALRRLALANIADLRPPAVAVWMLYSHPPIADRIEAARAEDAPKARL